MFARLCSIGFLTSSLIGTALLPAAGDAGAASVPDLATLRARVAAAEGTRPQRDKVTETYVHGETSGRRVVLRSGHDLRVDDTFGPFTTSSGTFGGQRWRQNENGETVLEQPDPGHALAETKTTSVTHVTAPVDAFVIAVLDARGEGTKEYIDRVTSRLIRHDDIDAVATTVTTYDDFRKTNGFVRPWHWTIRDGHPENDAEYHVVSDDGVSAADLQIPANRRILVEFPAGKTIVDLPAREFGSQFQVRVGIGGRGYDFTLDSGAAGISLDEDVVRELGLKTYGAFSNDYNAGRFRESRAVVPEMSVGELKMHDVAVTTIPHLATGADGVYKSVGLLGFDFIGDVALAIDYMNGRVTATSPEAFRPRKDPRTFAIPIRLGTGIPQTDVMVNDALGERFAIDTGWGTNMGIFDFFARRHPEAMGGETYAGNEPRFIGVGGEVRATPYRFASVKVGNIVFKDFIADRIASTKQYAFGDDGVIGVGLLQHFTVYTDYGNSTLYLVPNGRHDV